MNPKALLPVLILSALVVEPIFAQDAERSAPFTAAEREAIYIASIEKRATNMLADLAVADATKASRVQATIMAQYRALRSRDEAVDTMLKELGKNAPGVETNRAALLPIVSRTLHEQFITRLSADLTPEQIEKIKDKMTYDKVKVTYDAYCEIVPGLTDDEKARILKSLKAAREEAIDGGSADEKSAIFQKHKDIINAYLDLHGHDVNKATKEWEAKQKVKEEASAKKNQ